MSTPSSSFRPAAGKEAFGTEAADAARGPPSAARSEQEVTHLRRPSDLADGVGLLASGLLAGGLLANGRFATIGLPLSRSSPRLSALLVSSPFRPNPSRA